MKLSEIEPQLLVVEEPGKRYRYVDDIVGAQGVTLLCPACFAANGGPVGTHRIQCWFRDRGVLDTETPGPARWAVSGSGLADLTLSPSVQLIGGCAWHGFITNGEVSTC